MAATARSGRRELPPYGELRALDRRIAELEASKRLMERSLSWRVTAPLRRARSLVRRR